MRNMHVILINFSSRDIITYPAVLNWIRILSEKGWAIDLVANESMKTEEALPGTNCFWISDDKYNYYRQLKDLLDEKVSGNTWIIAFQIEGLLAAASLSNVIPPAKVVYVSLELVYKNYLKRSYLNWPFFVFMMARFVLVLIARESPSIWMGRLSVALFEAKNWLRLSTGGKYLVRFAVAQDCERVRLLKEELPYITDTYVVPNAYIDYDEAESHWAHSYFGLAAETKIVLFAGMIEEGFDLGLFDVLSRLPDGYVTILNAYSRDGFLDKIHHHLVNGVESGKIIMHRTFFSECDYDRLIRSCRIGLVWYSKPEPEDENMFFMGLSSGKLCKYLSRGKPVITQRGFSGYHELIDKNSIGITCIDAENLPHAVAVIETNYDEMQSAVRDFVGRHLDVKGAIENIVTLMEHGTRE